MGRIRAAIKQVASHLPEYSLTNEQLVREFGDWDGDKIRSKTGIAARRIAARDECSSDLGIAAAKALFAAGACDPRDVDFLLFCTQSPDHFLPTTACLAHAGLNLRESCAAVDINQGCSGYLYGLAVAKGLVESRVAENVLLITSDTYSKFINPRDRSTRSIFGDGAAATLIAQSTESDDEESIGPFLFGTDGGGAPNLIVRAGGMRCPATRETSIERSDDAGNFRSDENLSMNGAEVFAFALRSVPAAVNGLLARSGLGIADVDYFLFHQANKFMLERLRDKLDIPPAKFAIDMEDTGNTVSSSIPIALERATARGEVRPGDRVMLVGFGVGYSWAATLIRIP
ncbi:ketoacyl-ACP synthase III [Isosphaeraceae bacterium EP7]